MSINVCFRTHFLLLLLFYHGAKANSPIWGWSGSQLSPKRTSENCFLLAERLVSSQYHCFCLSCSQPPCLTPWGFSTMARAQGTLLGSPEKAENSSPERSCQSDLPCIFSLASSQPLTCVLKCHAALRKSLAHVVDSWPAVCQPSRWGPDARRGGDVRKACLSRLLSPTRPHTEGIRTCDLWLGYPELGHHLRPRNWEGDGKLEWDSFFQGRAPRVCGSGLLCSSLWPRLFCFCWAGALSKHKFTCLLREIVRGYRLWEKQQSWLSYGFVLCDDGGLSWWVCPTWQCAFVLGRLSSEGTTQSPNWRSHLLADVCVYVHTHTSHTGAHCSSVLRAWILESDIIIQVLF